MPIDKRSSPGAGQARKRGAARQWLAAAALAALLAACGGKEVPVGQVGNVSGFGGGVVADEPRATVVGRDILSAGGNAADAAVAIYFALAATYPSAASLGGGGYCVYHDPSRSNAVPQVLEFPRAKPAGGGEVALPGNVRGMGQLHSRHGKLRWEQLLAPAEHLARRGYPVARAYLKSLEDVAGTAGGAPDLGNLVFGGDSQGRREGQVMFQHDLAGVLARVRANGAGEFYAGPTARTLVAGMNQRGGAVDLADLRAVQAKWSGALAVALPGKRALFMPHDPGATVAARLWNGLGGAPAAPEQLVATLGAAYAEAGAPGPLASSGSTGFAAVDRDGKTVACAVSAGEPFGLRRIAPDTGVLLAPLPGVAGDEGLFLLPAIVSSTERGDYDTFAAIGAAGGETSAAALIETLRPLLLERRPAAEALAAPRVFRPSPTGQVLYEPGAAIGAADGAREVPALGRVNLIACPGGLGNKPQSCSFNPDKRGFGLGDGGLM